MHIEWQKQLGVVLLGILTALLLVGAAWAETTTQNIGVSFTVPAPSTTGTGGGGGSTGGGATAQTNPPAEEKPVDTPPVISNVSFVVTASQATITWIVSDNKGVAGSTFAYGTTMGYGQTAPVTGNYQAVLSSLSSNTVYYFRIRATDTAGQQAESTGAFRTKSGTLDKAPPVIFNISVKSGTTAATISWSTDEAADSQVNYGATNGYGNTALDKNAAFNHTVVIVNLLPNTTYHYRIISTDAEGNSAATADAVFTTLKDKVPTSNASNFSITPRASALLLSWKNPSLVAAPDFKGVKILKRTGSAPANPTDGTVIYSGAAESIVDGNVVVNERYYYTIFAFDSSNNYSSGISASGQIVPPAGQEHCSNGQDDDQDGTVDCADNDCSGLALCQKIPPGEPSIPSNSTPPGETSSGGSTVPEFARISADKLLFLAAGRQIKLTPAGSIITSLAHSSFTIGLPRPALVSYEGVVLWFIVDNQNRYQFQFDALSDTYYADLIFPSPGNKQAEVYIDYGAGGVDRVPLTLRSRPTGVVKDGPTPLPGVTVFLYNQDKTPFSAYVYDEKNPLVTNDSGEFGWLVPNGKYTISISHPGYYDYASGPLTVENNVLAPSISLIRIPPRLSTVIDPNAPLATNVKNVAKNLADKGKATAKRAAEGVVKTAKIAQELADNPQVEEAASTVVAPAAVSVVAVGVVPLVSWVDLLPLLRLLFLQPLLLVGRRKREKWGVIYNSLSKMPVDLAIVRLVDAATKRVVQSRVTDRQGRYFFTIQSGHYRVEVLKDKMLFPSELLRQYREDGQRTDIYHGEEIIVNDKYPVITANIPLDPAGEHKKPSRLRWEAVGRKAQHAISMAGLVVTVVSLYIAPKWHVAALLGVHITLMVVFRRLALPPKPKSWGIVYDATTKKPIGRAVARLFSAQFNKLVATQITDNKGRYYFLAGDHRFYVTYDHAEYKSHKTSQIDLSGKDAETISVKVGLEKSAHAGLKSDNSTSLPSPNTPLPSSAGAGSEPAPEKIAPPTIPDTKKS